MLVLAALLWSWSDFSKLGRRFGQALKIIRGLFKSQHVPEVYQPECPSSAGLYQLAA